MATRNQSLQFHEEILLLALRDEKGTVEFKASQYALAMAGGMIADLLLGKRIALEPKKSSTFLSFSFGSRHRKRGRARPATGPADLVDLIDSKRLGDDVLDECLEKLARAKRRASIQTWVTRFASIRRLKHRTAEGLCERGILRSEEGRVLLIFSRKIYPELNSQPERALIERLRAAIFTGTLELDARTVVLLSLANSAGLLKIPFAARDLRKRKQRIKEIVAGDAIGKATRQAIEAAQAAAAVAAIVPAMAATTH